MNRLFNNFKFKNLHCHLDKSNVIDGNIFKLSNVHMQKKWGLMQNIKQNYTEKSVFERMEKTVLNMKKQGVSQVRSFIDVDKTVGLMCWEQALILRSKYNTHNFKIEIGVQPLEGLTKKSNIALYEKACKDADFVGCLPSVDKIESDLHLDIAFTIAKKLGLPIEAHLDQLNIPEEDETNTFIDFVEMYEYQGKSNAIHCVSTSKKSPIEIYDIAERLHKNDVGVIVCPSAAISMKQERSDIGFISNSIAPIDIFHKRGVRIGLGTDNINDIFMPLCDGSLIFEIRLLAEACRIYDMEILQDIAENKGKI